MVWNWLLPVALQFKECIIIFIYKAQQEHIHQFLRDALVALPINIDDTFTSTYWVLMPI